MGFSEIPDARAARVRRESLGREPGSVATHFSERSDASWKLDAEDVAESVAFVVDTPADVLVHRVEVRTLTVPKKKS